MVLKLNDRVSESQPGAQKDGDPPPDVPGAVNEDGEDIPGGESEQDGNDGKQMDL